MTLMAPEKYFSARFSERFWTVFVEYLWRCFEKNIIYKTAIPQWYSEKTRQTILGVNEPTLCGEIGMESKKVLRKTTKWYDFVK